MELSWDLHKPYFRQSGGLGLSARQLRSEDCCVWPVDHSLKEKGVMSHYFNPGSPRFRRGVIVLSAWACTFVGAHVVMADFGKQEHVFSGIQRLLVPRIDQLLGVTEEEIRQYKAPEREKAERWLELKKVDRKKQQPPPAST